MRNQNGVVVARAWGRIDKGYSSNSTTEKGRRVMISKRFAACHMNTKCALPGNA
jgi:hypothetical protein